MIYLTGFGPFGEPGSVAHSSNPSEALARQAGARIGAQVEILPVSYRGVREVPSRVQDAELVLAIGVAGGRTRPMVEKVAVNWEEARIPDSDGDHATGRPIDPRGPDVLFSGWDLDRIAADCGINISRSAGTYVCNALSYALYRHHPKACFLHIPPEQYLGVDEGTDLVERMIECSMSA